MSNIFIYAQLMTILQWYFNNLVFYPAIICMTCIVIQYLCSPESKIRFFACYGVYWMWTVVICLVFWPFFVINAPAGVKNSMYGAFLLRPVANIIGIEFELRNLQYLDRSSGPAVVAATHQSIFDVLGMFTKWHIMEKCTAIARKKIFWFWPFGLLAWLAGVIFIDRIQSYSKTHEKVNNAAQYICRQKAKLWMFVEGTRNSTPEKLLPFKKGAFRVAIACQLPIIPVVYSPYYFINGKTKYFGRGKIIMEALEPISTKGLELTDMDTLIDKVYKLMSDKNEELRQEMLKKK